MTVMVALPWLLCFSSLLPYTLAVERVYYIGIVEEIWNYAPMGSNLITGVALENDTYGNALQMASKICGSNGFTGYHTNIHRKTS